MSEYDSPWKEALDHFLRLFLEFFFPNIAADVAWERGYQVLDKELEQIVRAGEMGNRLADKLFKVWRKNGEETWVLIHFEIQAQRENEFPRRMFVYHYRIFDKFQLPVASLAVLGDDNPGWRPTEFGYNMWDCEIRLRFPVVKLLDYGNDLAALETSPNPFGLIILAHLQSMATRGEKQSRYTWKVRVIKKLLDRGYSPEDIRLLFKLIDWMLELPEELAHQFEQEIHEYEMEKKMEYVTSVERHGMEKGRLEALKEMIGTILRSRFADASAPLLPAIDSMSDPQHLRKIHQAAWTADSLEEVQKLLPSS